MKKDVLIKVTLIFQKNVVVLYIISSFFMSLKSTIEKIKGT